MTDTSPSTPAVPTLNRSLSLTVLSFYGIGTILGAGIYVLTGEVAAAAGMATPSAFLLAAVLVLFSAFSYAELSARFPKSAGEAVYVREGLGIDWLARVVGLAIVVIAIVSSATLLHGFVGYLKLFVDAPDALGIVIMGLTLGAVVVWGIRQSALVAGLMTVLEIIGLLLVLWVARDSLGSLPARLHEMLPGGDTLVWAGVLAGSFIAFYAFVGFEDIVNVAEEVRDPVRNLPRAIFIAWLVTTVLYLAVSTVAVLAMSPESLAGSNAPLALIYQTVTGQQPVVLSLICLVSVLNGALTQNIVASRVLYGMSRQGWLPAIFGRVSPVTATPVFSSAFITVAILCMALWLPLLSLAKLTSLFTLSVFTLVNLSLWQVKRRQPQAPGWRTPYWVPVAGVIVNLAFLAYQLLHWD